MAYPSLLGYLQVLLEEVTGVVLLCHPQLQDVILSQTQGSCKMNQPGSVVVVELKLNPCNSHQLHFYF